MGNCVKSIKDEFQIDHISGIGSEPVVVVDQNYPDVKISLKIDGKEIPIVLSDKKKQDVDLGRSIAYKIWSEKIDIEKIRSLKIKEFDGYDAMFEYNKRVAETKMTATEPAYDS